jgi:hypothetical protein
LYVYYLANRETATATEKSQEETPNKAEIQPDIDYVGIIKAHFPDGIPDAVNINEVKATFHRLSSGESPIYKNDKQGFKNFANDYFETDMFSGEDGD